MDKLIHHPLAKMIKREMRYDQLTPILVYAAVGGVGACMLESAYDEGYGKYSFIGINPLGTFTANGHNITIEINGQSKSYTGDPYEYLTRFSSLRKAFGFVGYDAVRLKEKIPDRHESQATPDFLFHVYKTIIEFDHNAQKIIFAHEGTEEELDQIIKRAFTHVTVPQFKGAVPVNVKTNISDDEYMYMVRQAQEYIKAGDIFQVVLSRIFTAETNAKPLDVYRALRQISPTPYLTFFQEENFSIASASPELLVGVKNGKIESVPIAGTCKAGDDINKLLADPKENAEHVMLVDLARNDVGSVSKPGTVKVSQYKAIKAYSHVTHIVSRVVGELDPTYNALQVLKAALPAGTLSGAPKIRAMEIIDELETSRRGLYGGSIMLIDESGNITSSIAIRTAVIYPGRVEIRAGGGIVLDSVPENEAEETKLKARGVIAALELANGGLL
jgi:anthranilate synthase component 1